MITTTVTATVRCHDCKRLVPIHEAAEQTTYEGTHIRCEPCADAAYKRALEHEKKPSKTPDIELLTRVHDLLISIVNSRVGFLGTHPCYCPQLDTTFCDSLCADVGAIIEKQHNSYAQAKNEGAEDEEIKRRMSNAGWHRNDKNQWHPPSCIGSWTFNEAKRIFLEDEATQRSRNA